MLLENEKYKIEIKVIDDFTENQIMKSGFDYIHNFVGFGFDNDFMKYYDITVKSENKILRMALIGDYYIYENDCAVLENDVLTLIVNDKIARIDAETGKLIDFKKYEIMSIGEHIYCIPGGYIIKGECEIVRIDKNLKKVWGFMGADIFETISEKKPFVLCEDRIKLYDFNDCFYELDLNGKIVKTEGL